MDTTLDEYKKALLALKKALAEPKSDIVRDATIQRFEFCVELAWKTARKVMGTQSTAPKTVIREMAQNHFIDDVEFWLNAIDQRNLSPHTYKEALAASVYCFSRENGRVPPISDFPAQTERCQGISLWFTSSRQSSKIF